MTDHAVPNLPSRDFDATESFDVNNELTARLLPLLGRSLDAGFNVFDVMHHETHEKQLSNIFRWLLEIGGTHNFEDLGQRVFLDEINQSQGLESKPPQGTFTVRQDVNTSEKTCWTSSPRCARRVRRDSTRRRIDTLPPNGSRATLRYRHGSDSAREARFYSPSRRTSAPMEAQF